MNTAKALIAGLVVTIGLLAFSFAFEAVGQALGPEEEEHAEEVHEDETHAEDEADDIDLTTDDEEHGE